MKNILLTLICISFCLSVHGQIKINPNAIPATKTGTQFINSKTAFWVGMGSMFTAGFLQNLHTILVTEPDVYIKKFGGQDHRYDQNNTSFPFNSFLSPFKNRDHALQAGTTFFAGTGAVLLTYNFCEGWKFKENSFWKNALQITGALVASRVAMGLGGQASNLWVKGQLDPL